ncbi:Yip1 family protein [Halorussus ruber]|uniref:Yip1 family protein n=1 Tax=Halorussus ruber TaxID=1126238 RepID=UPI00109246E6|nr:Yip1 family protein [Halorussus ruber]
MVGVELFRDTESFFDRRTSSGFAVPGAIVLLTALISVVNDIYVINWQFSNTEMNMTILYVLTGLVSGGLPILVWVLVTACFHGIATVVYESDASFKRLLQLTAYGMVPYALGSLVSFAVTMVVVNDLSAPTSAAEATQTALSNDWRIVAVGYLFLAFLVWSADIWAVAVQSVHDVSQKRAFAIVAGPVVVLLAVMWYLLVGA